jgi:hypothetical protein
MKEFKLDEVEEEKAKSFIIKHLESCGVFNQHGFPLGPLFSYIFTSSGIGTGISIRCSKCEEIENITNYDKW